ncbi:MAG: hypothetical protein ACTSP4_15445, partial [Candidatus Hodarchaeales archaeon]
LTTIIALIAVSSIAPAMSFWFKRPTLTMYLYDAYYCCLDGDSIEDDVVASVYISIDSYLYTNEMDLYSWLTLPNGTVFSYGLNIIAQSNSQIVTFSIDLLFFNHAYECGDYMVETLGDLSGDRYYVYSWIIFDPPGGKPGANPDFGWDITLL